MSQFHDPADGFAESYAVALLYGLAPALDGDIVERSVRRHSPGLETIEAPESSSADAPEHSPSVERAASSSGAFVLTARHPTDPSMPTPAWRISTPTPMDPATLGAAARQTWWWEDGRQTLDRCRHGLVISDHRAAGLPYRTRVELFQRTLVGVLEAYPALAIEWRTSQQLVSPQELVETALADGFSNPLPGAVNVRFFRIDTADGGKEEMLMDTLGLAALGLPDLQCHFRGLEPNDVSRVLYTTACYVYDHGSVLKNGDTVAGPGPQDRWRCQLEHAIAQPRRPVFDLDPGFPFAGGESEEDHVLSGER